MKVVILGSSGGDPGARQYVSSYLINDSIAIDAGCLGFHGSPDQQARVRHVFLTHSAFGPHYEFADLHRECLDAIS